MRHTDSTYQHNAGGLFRGYAALHDITVCHEMAKRVQLVKTRNSICYEVPLRKKNPLLDKTSPALYHCRLKG